MDSSVLICTVLFMMRAVQALGAQDQVVNGSANSACTSAAFQSAYLTIRCRTMPERAGSCQRGAAP